MFNIVLFQPQIPQNTGNIARTCACTGTALHLIRPLGFDISESAIKRAGLDYWDKVRIYEYDGIDEFFRKNAGGEFWFLSKKASKSYCDVRFGDGCFLVFGKETTGLPDEILTRFSDRALRIPMRGGVRCLNLSNSAAVVLYEALRQSGFESLE